MSVNTENIFKYYNKLGYKLLSSDVQHFYSNKVSDKFLDNFYNIFYDKTKNKEVIRIQFSQYSNYWNYINNHRGSLFYVAHKGNKIIFIKNDNCYDNKFCFKLSRKNYMFTIPVEDMDLTLNGCIGNFSVDEITENSIQITLDGNKINNEHDMSNNNQSRSNYNVLSKSIIVSSIIIGLVSLIRKN